MKSLRLPKSGSGCRAKKKYYLADYLQFLLPFTKAGEGSKEGNLNDASLTEDGEGNLTALGDTGEDETAGNINENQKRKEALNEKIFDNKEKSSRKNTSANAADEAFIEWVKCKKQKKTADDSDELFARSIVKYMKEMTGKQNRRFRQKVMSLIDDVLENVDDISASSTSSFSNYTRPLISSLARSSESYSPVSEYETNMYPMSPPLISQYSENESQINTSFSQQNNTTQPSTSNNNQPQHMQRQLIPSAHSDREVSNAPTTILYVAQGHSSSSYQSLQN